MEDNKTFGYHNEFLEMCGIDPTILHELPEDMRADIFANLDP